MSARDEIVTRLPLPQNRLGWLRRASGMSAPDVAERVGVHQATLYRWEKGESGIPDHQKYALAQLFDVSVSLLMNWDPPAQGGAL